MIGDLDAECGALALYLGLFLPRCLRGLTVGIGRALVVSRQRVELARLLGQIAGHQASGSWCWVTRRPNFSAALAALGFTSALNSSVSPVGSPLR